MEELQEAYSRVSTDNNCSRFPSHGEMQDCNSIIPDIPNPPCPRQRGRKWLPVIRPSTLFSRTRPPSPNLNQLLVYGYLHQTKVSPPDHTLLQPGGYCTAESTCTGKLPTGAQSDIHDTLPRSLRGQNICHDVDCQRKSKERPPLAVCVSGEPCEPCEGWGFP